MHVFHINKPLLHSFTRTLSKLNELMKMYADIPGCNVLVPRRLLVDQLGPHTSCDNDNEDVSKGNTGVCKDGRGGTEERMAGELNVFAMLSDRNIGIAKFVQEIDVHLKQMALDNYKVLSSPHSVRSSRKSISPISSDSRNNSRKSNGAIQSTNQPIHQKTQEIPSKNTMNSTVSGAEIFSNENDEYIESICTLSDESNLTSNRSSASTFESDISRQREEVNYAHFPVQPERRSELQPREINQQAGKIIETATVAILDAKDRYREEFQRISEESREDNEFRIRSQSSFVWKLASTISFGTELKNWKAIKQSTKHVRSSCKSRFNILLQDNQPYDDYPHKQVVICIYPFINLRFLENISLIIGIQNII